MMVHKLDKQVLAGAGTLRGIVQNQDVNGLLIVQSIAPTASDYLSVTLKQGPPKTPEVLINRISLLALAEIADIERGMSVGLQADQQAETGGTTMAMYAFTVDLGRLKNQANDSSLEILVELAGAQTAALYTYFVDDGTDEIRKYIQSAVLTDKYNDVDKLYLYTSSAYNADFATRDVNIMVRANSQAVVADLMGAVGMTYSLGEIEATGPKQVVKIYENYDGIHDTVDINVSGGGVSTFQVIAVSVMNDRERISKANIQNVDRIISTVSRKPAETQSALKRAGKIPVNLQSLRTNLNAG